MFVVLDQSYKGYDISVYQYEDEMHRFDVKYPCGEAIEIADNIDCFVSGLSIAKGIIDNLPPFNGHCESEYCLGVSHA